MATKGSTLILQRCIGGTTLPDRKIPAHSPVYVRVAVICLVLTGAVLTGGMAFLRPAMAPDWELPFDLPEGHRIVSLEEPVCAERGPLGPLGECESYGDDFPKLQVDVVTANGMNETIDQLKRHLEPSGIVVEWKGNGIRIYTQGPPTWFAEVVSVEATSEGTAYRLILEGLVPS